MCDDVALAVLWMFGIRVQQSVQTNTEEAIRSQSEDKQFSVTMTMLENENIN